MIDFTLSDENQKIFHNVMNDEMEKVINHFERELATIRSNRAHPSIVEHLKISCYNGASMMELKHIAAISAPDISLITIEPWDKSVINDIEKAISNSDLGLTPENDGSFIRIRLPKVSSERRAELIKVLHKKLEEGKVSVRNIRKEFKNLIERSLKQKDISEDHSRRLLELLQKVTDAFIAQLDQKSQKKEQELSGK